MGPLYRGREGILATAMGVVGGQVAHLKASDTIGTLPTEAQRVCVQERGRRCS